MTQTADLLVVGASQVLTCKRHSRPARGKDQAKIGAMTGVAVAIGSGKVLAVGDEKDLRKTYSVDDRGVIDAKGGVVMPGFVDSHTHMVFAGDRASEWESRMQGKPYLEILREGGGILSTVVHTRKASEDELLVHAQKWAKRFLALGTTTVEVKSGYGLTAADELKILRVANELGRSERLSVVTTFLGAHVVPPEYTSDRERYLAVVEATAKQVATNKLASFADVFCESEAFSIEETERLLRQAQGLGLGLKIHAEQFAPSGAARLGSELGATSIDHLEHISDDDITALAGAPRPSVGVLLPAVTFHLGMDRYAPARALIEAGVPIALATDFNPGSSFTPSLPMVIALACRFLRMSVAEAIVATTINAAFALGRHADTGSIEPGKRADLIILDVPDHRWLGYAFGFNPVAEVIVDGMRIPGA